MWLFLPLVCQSSQRLGSDRSGYLRSSYRRNNRMMATRTGVVRPSKS
jgi:hypothetical protein